MVPMYVSLWRRCNTGLLHRCRVDKDEPNQDEIGLLLFWVTTYIRTQEMYASSRFFVDTTGGLLWTWCPVRTFFSFDDTF